MTDKKQTRKQGKTKFDKRAEALRENLRKRKQQDRARQEGEEEQKT